MADLCSFAAFAHTLFSAASYSLSNCCSCASYSLFNSSVCSYFCFLVAGIAASSLEASKSNILCDFNLHAGFLTSGALPVLFTENRNNESQLCLKSLCVDLVLDFSPCCYTKSTHSLYFGGHWLIINTLFIFQETP